MCTLQNIDSIRDRWGSSHRMQKCLVELGREYVAEKADCFFLEAWTSIVHRGRAKVRVAGRSLWGESWVCLQKHFCLKVPQTPAAQEMPSQMFISKMTAISQVPIAFLCLSLLVWERPLAQNLDRFLGGKREPFLPLGTVWEEGTWLTSSSDWSRWCYPSCPEWMRPLRQNSCEMERLRTD